MRTEHEQAKAQTPIDCLASQARCEFIDHEGRRVCWRGFGAGRPVVLLHGGHGNWLHWVRNIEALAAHHAVWVPDLPGYGDSDDPVPGGGLPSLVGPVMANGYGFPRWEGGPVFWARNRGREALQQDLDWLAERSGAGFVRGDVHHLLLNEET